MVRLRQLVWAAKDLASADTLQAVLGLGPGYPDPGVQEFGLENAVFALGDQFLELVVPVNPSAPAQRFIDRSGEGGYMAIFQTDDLAAARARIDAAGFRRVWNIDLEDISASHVHPADLGGAIVSIDEARPKGSWRWAGPDWQARSAPGRLCGVDLTSPDPETLAKRWAGALGVSLQTEDGVLQIETQDGPVRFLEDAGEGLTAFHLAVPDREACLARARSLDLDVYDTGCVLCGVSLHLHGHN